MKYGHGRSRIDDHRRERRSAVWFAAGAAQESIQCLRLLLPIRLDPDPHIERIPLSNIAFEHRFVGDQDIRAAVGQNAAHFSQCQHRVQRNRDAPGANDRQNQ